MHALSMRMHNSNNLFPLLSFVGVGRAAAIHSPFIDSRPAGAVLVDLAGSLSFSPAGAPARGGWAERDSTSIERNGTRWLAGQAKKKGSFNGGGSGGCSSQREQRTASQTERTVFPNTPEP